MCALPLLLRPQPHSEDETKTQHRPEQADEQPSRGPCNFVGRFRMRTRQAETWNGRDGRGPKGNSCPKCEDRNPHPLHAHSSPDPPPPGEANGSDGEFFTYITTHTTTEFASPLAIPAPTFGRYLFVPSRCHHPTAGALRSRTVAILLLYISIDLYLCNARRALSLVLSATPAHERADGRSDSCLSLSCRFLGRKKIAPFWPPHGFKLLKNPFHARPLPLLSSRCSCRFATPSR